MHGVVVPRPTEVGQPAGHRQAARIVQRQAQFLRPHLHGGGEARVEVEHRHVGQANPSHLQRPLAGPAHRRAGVEVLSFQGMPQVVRVGAAVQEHPAIHRHAHLPRRLDAADQHPGRLVDLHDGVEVLRVRIADHPVVRCHRHQFFRRPRRREPGVGIGGGGLGERREQPAQVGLVGLEASAVPRPQRILEQGIGVHRQAQAVGVLMRRGSWPRLAHPHWRGGRLLAVALEVHAGLQASHD